VTALTLLLTGVDWFMMMHPAAVKTVKDVIRAFTRGETASAETIVDWLQVKL
jgi:acetyl-CoA decarbonylase/synthase complex subunit delta